MFKVGDKVERIDGCHGGMHIGDTSFVKSMADFNNMYLTDFDLEAGHDPIMFKKINQTWKEKYGS